MHNHCFSSTKDYKKFAKLLSQSLIQIYAQSLFLLNEGLRKICKNTFTVTHTDLCTIIVSPQRRITKNLQKYFHSHSYRFMHNHCFSSTKDYEKFAKILSQSLIQIYAQSLFLLNEGLQKICKNTFTVTHTDLCTIIVSPQRSITKKKCKQFSWNNFLQWKKLV